METTQRLRRELIDPKFGLKADDLRLALRLFEQRKKAAPAPGLKAQLDGVSRLLAEGAPNDARKILNQLEAAAPK